MEKEKVSYALIGGVAMAFHDQARFTKDIDLLTDEEQLLTIESLKRYWKVEDGDEMIIDVLMGTTHRHAEIIENALEAHSKRTGIVRVATKEDLIWLKSQCNSALDKADIEHLENDE